MKKRDASANLRQAGQPILTTAADRKHGFNLVERPEQPNAATVKAQLRPCLQEASSMRVADGGLGAAKREQK